jgi:hypothetical protein
MEKTNEINVKENTSIYSPKNYYTNGEFSLDTILTNLDNIAKIAVGEKLTNDGKYITVEHSYLKWAYRKYNNINRNTNLAFIETIINESYQYMDLLRSNNDDASGIMWIKLGNKLKQCTKGLLNYRRTYIHDEKFTMNIDRVIKRLL